MSEAWNALAVPWNSAWMLGGHRELALVVDDQGRVLEAHVGERGQGDGAALCGAQVDVLQVVGMLLEVGAHFQHHAVLVELGEHGRDLPLAEGVVEGVVQHLGRDPEA